MKFIGPILGLCLTMTACKKQTPVIESTIKANEIIISFKDEQVPVFIVVEENGRRQVIIDTSHLPPLKKEK